MAKIISRALVLILALTLLAACGNDNNATGASQGGATTSGAPQSDTTAPASPGGGAVDFAAIFEGRSDMRLTGLSESEKQAIVGVGEAAGVEVVFGNGDDVFFKRLSDGYVAAWTLGSWSFYSEADKKAPEWPDDEFTKLIPKPDFSLKTAGTGDKFIACFQDVTLEQVKAYAESLKAAGFTLNPATDEAITYKYAASNGAGYMVELTRYTGDDQVVYIIITKE